MSLDTLIKKASVNGIVQQGRENDLRALILAECPPAPASAVEPVAEPEPEKQAPAPPEEGETHAH